MFYVLFLEIDFNALSLQLARHGQAVHRVSGDAAHALGDDQIDLTVQRFRDHIFEALTVFGVGSSDSFVYCLSLPVRPDEVHIPLYQRT